MQTKLNNKLKVIIISLFTVLVIGGAVLGFGNPSHKRKTYEQLTKYSEKPYDTHLAVDIRESETRKSKYYTKTQHEKSIFDIQVTLIKLETSSIISNVKLYIVSKTKQGSYEYEDYSTSSKSLTAQTWTSITSFSNFSTRSFEKITKDEKEVEVLFDEQPEELFIRVTYDYQSNSSATKEEGNELTFKTATMNVDVKDFSNLEARQTIPNTDSTNPKYIDPQSDPVRFKITKTFTTETSKEGSIKEDKIKFEIHPSITNLSKLTLKEDEIKEKKLNQIELPKAEGAEDQYLVKPELSNIKVEIWGKIKSEDGKLGDYVKFYANYGFLSRYRIMSTYTASIDESLEITELYIFIEGTIHNGITDRFETSYKLDCSTLMEINS